jgi:4-oxalocrotonate tautomerase
MGPAAARCRCIPIRRLFLPTVTVLQGPRSAELKRALVAGITDAFVGTLGVPAGSVQVWIQETPADSWGQGGVLTADK